MKNQPRRCTLFAGESESECSSPRDVVPLPCGARPPHRSYLLPPDPGPTLDPSLLRVHSVSTTECITVRDETNSLTFYPTPPPLRCSPSPPSVLFSFLFSLPLPPTPTLVRPACTAAAVPLPPPPAGSYSPHPAPAAPRVRPESSGSRTPPPGRRGLGIRPRVARARRTAPSPARRAVVPPCAASETVEGPPRWAPAAWGIREGSATADPGRGTYMGDGG